MRGCFGLYSGKEVAKIAEKDEKTEDYLATQGVWEDMLDKKVGELGRYMFHEHMEPLTPLLILNISRFVQEALILARKEGVAEGHLREIAGEDDRITKEEADEEKLEWA